MASTPAFQEAMGKLPPEDRRAFSEEFRDAAVRMAAGWKRHAVFSLCFTKEIEKCLPQLIYEY